MQRKENIVNTWLSRYAGTQLKDFSKSKLGWWGGRVALPRSFELYVVEDTMGEIRSTQATGEVQLQTGFNVTVHALGLTSGSVAKADAFDKTGIRHFKTWDDLISVL